MSLNYFLKLLNNWCGNRDVTANWFEALSKAIEERGFAQITIDLYLFSRGYCIAIARVDDFLVLHKKKDALIDLIDSLKDEFKLTDAVYLDSFLGTHFNKINNNALEVSQTHLVQILIE